MKPETRKEMLNRFTKAIKKLDRYGFEVVGQFLFRKDGVVHDLSATDLNCAIEKLNGV